MTTEKLKPASESISGEAVLQEGSCMSTPWIVFVL
jgi:hypothetical protein